MFSAYLEEFKYVRETFFPGWDRNGHWRLVIEKDLDGAYGVCNQESKTIKVIESEDIGSLRTVLIHQIAHAITNCGHAKLWQLRMEKAARMAEQLGRKDLARDIRRDTEDSVMEGII